MRRYLIPLLLASALTPAAASAAIGDRGDRAQAEPGERAKSSENRPQRSERAVRTERPQRAERVQVDRSSNIERAVRAERPVRANVLDHAARPERVRPVRTERTDRPVRVRREVEQVQVSEPVQQVRTRRSSSSLADGFRDVAQGGNVERHDRNRDRHHWSSDWRHDHRYNWYSHRNRYGSLYRLGRYYDPYGWGYSRFSIGFSLWPSYFGSNYWLNDPWMYRLPPAYGPYRWIRYYDDALLVNIYTGQVVDVVYNFFW